MRLQDASVGQLLDALGEKVDWIAVVCSVDREVAIVCQGQNGLEILGGITFLLESQQNAVRERLGFQPK